MARGLHLGQPLLHAAEISLQPPGAAEPGKTILLAGQQGSLWCIQGTERDLKLGPMLKRGWRRAWPKFYSTSLTQPHPQLLRNHGISRSPNPKDEVRVSEKLETQGGLGRQLCALGKFIQPKTSKRNPPVSATEGYDYVCTTAPRHFLSFIYSSAEDGNQGLTHAKQVFCCPQTPAR